LSLQQAGRDALKLRQTHFIMGTDDGITGAQSVYKSNFEKPGHTEQAALQKEVMNDLRKHHFRFGYTQGDPKSSEMRSQYVDKSSQQDHAKTRQEITNFKSTIRQHADKFVDDQNYFHTSYGETFMDKTKEVSTNAKVHQRSTHHSPAPLRLGHQGRYPKAFGRDEKLEHRLRLR
jgi:hypothetical protein